MKRHLLYDAKPEDGGNSFNRDATFHGKRSLNFASESPKIDVEKRTVELSFSSEFPVERWGCKEILVHTADSVDLSRLNNGHPLLLGHDTDDQIGVVERAWLDETAKKGRAVVRFSESADAEKVFRDVVSGIRRLVSVGYSVDPKSWTEERNQETGVLEVCRALRWTPYEISIVSIPADVTVGVGRNHNNMNKNTLFDAGTGATGAGGNGSAATGTIDFNAERERIRNEELKRSREINAVQAKFASRGVTDEDAQRFIAEGKSVAEFNNLVLERVFNAKPIESIDPNIGLNAKEKRQFSICNAILQMATNGRLEGLEKEASDAHCKRNGIEIKSARTFVVPHDITSHRSGGTRALSVGTYASGGALVGVEYDPTIIELLRNKPVMSQLGARQMMLPKCGNVLISKQSGGGTAYWLAENASVTEASLTTAQLLLTPKRLAAYTLVSTSLLHQGGVDAESFVKNDLATVLALAKDRGALHGLGAAGEPLGLLAAGSGIGNGSSAVTGTSIAWDDILNFEAVVATANAEEGSLKWLASPAGRRVLKGRQKVDTYGTEFLWDRDGTINGQPALITNQLATSRLVYGNWQDLIMADYAGVEITVDQITGLGTDQVKVYAKLYCDIGIRHIESFVVTSGVLN